MTHFLAKQLVLVWMLVVTCTAMAGDSLTNQIDKNSGLIIAPGWEAVKANCTACHSAKFITGQRGDRETWKSMIRWMQKTQGLWQIPSKTEVTILDYLATNYPPNEPSRRANLPASLMPDALDSAP